MKIPALLFLAAASAAAQDPAAAPPRAGVPDLDAFARLPILENGRVMPMDSYARIKLLEFSGREQVLDKDASGKKTLHTESAVSWLARTLFTPSATATNQIFMINHPELLTAIRVEERKGRRYSYQDLRPGAQALADLARKAGTARSEEEQKALTLVDQEAYRVFAALTQYLMFTVAFEYARPQMRIEQPELRRQMGLPDGQVMFNFLDLFERMGSLHGLVSGVAAKPSDQWTPLEQEAMRVAFTLKETSERYQGLAFSPIPSAPHGEREYLSPWDAIAFGRGDAAMMAAVAAYGRMVNAYTLGDQKAFDDGAAAVVDATRDRWEGGEKTLRRAAQEAVFNRAQYFYRAKVWYIVAFLVSFGAFLTNHRWARRAAVALVLVALAYQVTGITWRVVLTGRPPVTNLYGTFIFVSAVCAVLGLAVEGFQRNGLGTLGASLVGAVFLFIASKFALEGDTMGKLVAVLDSNFWLSTHVIAITIGYAGCWLAGILAHVYLVMAVAKPLHQPVMRSVYNATNGILAFGLTFAFLGTMLGGVWADQSWGRFWGWDPKENGALLIVLWCAVLYHARIGGMIREIGLAAGVAIGNLVVMAAWLGVNLLGVGLHSYGFTKGATIALLTYFAVDTLLIAALGGVAWLRRRPAVA